MRATKNKKSRATTKSMKRVIRTQIDFEKWMKSIEKGPLSPRAIAAVDKVISARRRPHA
jgi:hypothetical protein